mgnify:CR=1 FL=1
MCPTVDRRNLALYVGLVVVATLSVTAAIMGVRAIIEGHAMDVGSRVPYYVFFMAVVVTLLVFLLEREIDDGWKIISTSLAIGVLAFVISLLGVEGALFGLENPDQVLSNITFYFISAGLLCTSVTYWAVNHWREFISTGPTGHRR